MADTLTSDNELTYASFPIEKVEETADGNVLVWGKATDGSVDSDEQIVDPDFAEKAMKEFFSSGPNIRVQHQAQRDPAGVGVDWERDGDSHWLKAKVIEPVAKQLVLGGALRAYSVGIARPTIQRDGRARGGRITDGMFVEVSLVDRPANKNCGISLVKGADGAIMTKVFGADDFLTKNAVQDVQITLPADVQVGFSPLDLAKIIKRRNTADGESLTGILTKQVQNGLKSVDEARAELELEPWGLPETSTTLGKAMAIVEDREYDETFTGKRKLTSEARNALPASDFVFPGDRRYPIHDRSHAQNALARASGKPEEARVRAAVSRRYPNIGKGKKKAAKKAAAMVANEAIPDMTKPKGDGFGPSPSDGDKAACAGCGAMQNNKHAFCSECGKSMAGAIPIAKNHDFMCLKCGYQLDKGEAFCPDCGTGNPGYNPMADMKIPANKSEGSRVADEPAVATETAEKKMKPKKGGKPFGGSQAPPFGKPKDGDGDGDGKATKGKKLKLKITRDEDDPTLPGNEAKVSGDYPQSGMSASGGGSAMKDAAVSPMVATPGGAAAKAKKPKKTRMPKGGNPGAGVTGSGAGSTKPVPAPRSSSPEASGFQRNPGDIQVKCAMRLKNLGVSQEDGFLHDLTCPAYNWQDVIDAYPDGLANFSAKSWQDKALEIAATAPLAQAKSAVMLGQHAYTLKGAALEDLMDVKMDLFKAFKDANPGPGTFPTPSEICATSFTRPKITSGRAAYSQQYGGPNSARIPSGSASASSFQREPLAGRVSDSPASVPAQKGLPSVAPYPQETGVVMNLDYSSVHKSNVLDAMRAMHDHFDRVMPSGVCPLIQQESGSLGNASPAHPTPTPVAQKSDDEPVIDKGISPDGMSGKQRKKLKKKLTKKVMSGKMPLDQARIRMGKKPKKSPEPLAPQKAAEPDVTKIPRTGAEKVLLAADDLTGDLQKMFKSYVKTQDKRNSKKFAALTKIVNALADQPDPATQPFKGLAVNPIRKSASPAGVQEIASVAERTQMMVLRELEDTARNSTDSGTREAAWNQVLKLKGLIS